MKKAKLLKAATHAPPETRWAVKRIADAAGSWDELKQKLDAEFGGHGDALPRDQYRSLHDGSVPAQHSSEASVLWRKTLIVKRWRTVLRMWINS